MSSRSLTFLFIFASLVLRGTMRVDAAPQTYETYQTEANSYCNSSGQTWSKYNTLVPKIDYPAFDLASVNRTLAKSSNNSTVVGDEKLRLKSDLDPVTIGEYSGFKTVEIARINYRTQMNSLFACAVIASRIDTMDSLTRLIQTKIRVKDSETYKKLTRMTEGLTTTYNTLRCNGSKSSANVAK
jgi:hypothetical protein